MTKQLHFHFSLTCIEEGNSNPLQCSCLENPRDGGAWWAAVYGVAPSWTWLKQLSSSSSSRRWWYFLFIVCWGQWRGWEQVPVFLWDQVSDFEDLLILRNWFISSHLTVLPVTTSQNLHAFWNDSLFTRNILCSQPRPMKQERLPLPP